VVEDLWQSTQPCRPGLEPSIRPLWGLEARAALASRLDRRQVALEVESQEWRAHQRDASTRLSNYSGETAANCVAEMHGRPEPARGAIAAPTASASAPATPTAGCRIKGNISQSGRIYHVPGSPFYDQTRIDESKGERWFCTEAEARAAGWRAPR
jgi:hypothetical protein